MQKIIVTGATGFIGRYAVDTLLKLGFEVIGISRHKALDDKKHYTLVLTDICRENEVEKLFIDNPDCIGLVHLAADIDMTGTAATIETNCVGTYYLAKCAVKYGLQFFINVSSISVIGKPAILPIDETHPVNPLTLYHITKLTAEQIVENICSPYMNVLTLRLQSPIGIGMNSKNYLSMLLGKIVRNEIVEVYGQGMRRQNYIDVRDIMAAIQRAIIVQKSGMYLIPGKESILNIELALLCKEVMNSSSKIITGHRIDLEDGDCWEISGKKAYEQLGFTSQYSIKDSIMWISESMRVV